MISRRLLRQRIRRLRRLGFSLRDIERALRRAPRANPPRRVSAEIASSIPGTLEEIRYLRGGKHPGPYKHEFTTPASMFALRDGGILIRPRTKKKLWGRY